MRKHFLVQWTIEKTGNIDSIPRWFDAFLIDRRAQELSEGTLRFYRDKLKLIDAHFSAQGIANISEITPLAIRTMLIALEADGHNRGGVHHFLQIIGMLNLLSSITIVAYNVKGLSKSINRLSA